MRNPLANPVGYDSNTAAPTLGAKIVTPFFLNVGSTSGCKLSDIKVTGYSGVAMGQVHLNSLDSAGRTIEIDDGTGTGGKIQKIYNWRDVSYMSQPAGWYDNKNQPLKDNKSVLGNADEISITASDSFWCYGAANFKLQFAGAVNQALVSVSAKFLGAKAIGNPFAAPIKLSDIYVNGYTGAAMGQVHLNVLDSAGRTIEIDDGTGTGGKIQKIYNWREVSYMSQPAGWYDNKNQPLKDGKSVLGNADEISIDPGVGFWVYGNTSANYMLNITCPISK